MEPDHTNGAVQTVKEMLISGDGFLDQGDHKRAALAFETALQVEPGNTSAAIGKAAALTLLGDLAEAEQFLAGVDETALTSPEDLRRYAFWLAYLAAEKGQHETALELIEEWLPRVNDHGRARLKILAARSMLQRQRPEQGRIALSQAWEMIDRNDRPSVMWLANIAFLARHYEVAGDAGSAAIRLGSSPALLFLRLFSTWYQLKPIVRIVAALFIAALIFIPPWGGYVLAGLEGLLVVIAILGWRSRVGGLIVSSLATGAGLLLAYLFIQLYRALT